MRDEIRRLRDWKHDVDKSLQALALLRDAVESVEGRTAALQERLLKVEERVQSIIEADKIGEAVAHAMQKQRGGVFTRRQRWFGYAVALAAVVGAVWPIIHAAT